MNIFSLPIENIFDIFYFIDIFNLIKIRLVSKNFNELILKNISKSVYIYLKFLDIDKINNLSKFLTNELESLILNTCSLNHNLRNSKLVQFANLKNMTLVNSYYINPEYLLEKTEVLTLINCQIEFHTIKEIKNKKIIIKNSVIKMWYHDSLDDTVYVKFINCEFTGEKLNCKITSLPHGSIYNTNIQKYPNIVQCNIRFHDFNMYSGVYGLGGYKIWEADPEKMLRIISKS